MVRSRVTSILQRGTRVGLHALRSCCPHPNFPGAQLSFDYGRFFALRAQAGKNARAPNSLPRTLTLDFGEVSGVRDTASRLRDSASDDFGAASHLRDAAGRDFGTVSRLRDSASHDFGTASGLRDFASCDFGTASGVRDSASGDFGEASGVRDSASGDFGEANGLRDDGSWLLSDERPFRNRRICST